MSDANDNDNGRNPGTRTPLSLKPRSGGAVSMGVTKQQFSHGRTKTVQVEIKRTRTHAPGGAGAGLGGPSAAEKRATFDAPKPRDTAPTGRGAPSAGGASLNLSAEELKAR